jgi:PAS domain S-box-containing protein
MKKIYYLVIVIIGVVILANIYYFIDIYKSQIKFQRELVTRQVQLCGSRIEQVGNEFENEINYILFSDDIAGLFSKEDFRERGTKKLENFYSKYQNLITNIRIYDSRSNVLNLTKDIKNQFYTDFYSTHKQKELISKDQVEFQKNVFKFYLPVYKENAVFANIEVTCDFVGFINKEFNNFHAGNTIWQYLVTDEGDVIIQNYSTQPIKVTNIQQLADSLILGNEGWMMQKVKTNGDEQKILAVYYPVHFLKQDFGVVFALQTAVILTLIVNKAIIISLISLTLLIFTLIFFTRIIKQSREEEEKLIESENTLNKIVEFLPIGIIVIDKNQLIRMINKTASNILSIRSASELIGHKIADSLEWSENYIKPDFYENAFDAEHFINYSRDGLEMVILKKEIPIYLGKEELFIEAFIDITAIEKARKQEAAANNAKSEFLAKTSHEIRTPMNGIIGMADALTHWDLNDEQKEQVNIIRKSADLLLMILNDILDYSKIEAGKMLLEEIPFQLREELNIVLELFKPAAESKMVAIKLDIQPAVINNLIGDPFRLRQVISNILGNAVKFTSEGKIVVRVEQIEEYSGNITLKFSIADTGIGIPAGKITNIFGSFTQVDGSTTRKYGGSGLGTTISKQLVELMNGEISVESPSGLSVNPNYPGSAFNFTIEVFSNEKLKKTFDFSHILLYEQIKALIISDRLEVEKNFALVFSNLGIKVSQKPYNKALFDGLLSPDNKEELHVIIIIDSPYFDGFKVAEKLKESGLSDKYLVIFFSSNNKQGNYIRSRNLGVDNYIIQPHEASEIFDIIQNHFTSIKRDLDLPPAITHIRKNISIILAEDNLINQKVAQTLFKNIGFEIDIANDGNQLIKMIALKKYDIIFMDVMMPEKDGIQATIELRAKGVKLPIIAMTASASKTDVDRAYSIGMNDYVIKPVRINKVKTILLRYFSESKT